MSTLRTETNVAAAQTYRVVTEIEEEELFEINNGLVAGRAMKKEEEEEEEIEEIGSLFSVDVNSNYSKSEKRRDEESVYVAVGKSESSMDALSWTLTHFVNNTSNTLIYLIHAFPHIRYIPSPLGMLPKSQVSPTQLERYMSQERGKRTQLLQKFLHICSASKVKVDTVLVESDMVAKAILDLIPILNITKLVLGTTNSNPRKLQKSSRGVGIADQVYQHAPITCEVKVVCQGKEVIINQMIRSPSPSPPPNQEALRAADDHPKDSFSCMCFKPKF